MKKKAIYITIFISLIIIAIYILTNIYGFQTYNDSLGKVDKVDIETKKSYSTDRYTIVNTEMKTHLESNYSSSAVSGQLTYEQFIVNESLVALDTNPVPYLKYIIEKGDDGEDERKAKLDATIETWEIEELDEDTEVRYYPYGNLLEDEQIFENQEKKPSATNPFGFKNKVRATSRTIAKYDQSTQKTLTSEEAWILAHGRTLSKSGSIPKSETEEDGEVEDYSKARIDKVQKSMWKLKGYSDYEENFGENDVAEKIAANLTQEAIWMRLSTIKRDILSAPIVDNNSVADYETLKAGIVSYNYGTKEFLVGPFSINYVRDAHEPLEGGLSDTISSEQGGGNLILYSGIVGANVWAVVNNQEQLLTDWQFVYNDVVMDGDTVKRRAIVNAGEFGDEDDNIYPYPNEEFYIKFLNPNNSIQAITKLEFKLQTLNAEGRAKELRGTYSEVNWVVGEEWKSQVTQPGFTKDEGHYETRWRNKIDANGNVILDENGNPVKESYQVWIPKIVTYPTLRKYTYKTFIKDQERSRPSAAKLYQIQSAKIYTKTETIQLKVGAKHPDYRPGYCIPLTMEIAGTVWIDGAESTRRRKRYKRRWRIWKRQCKSTFI